MKTSNFDELFKKVTINEKNQIANNIVSYSIISINNK